MNNRRNFAPKVFVPLFIATSTRFATFLGIDVVRLIASGMCLVFAIKGRSTPAPIAPPENLVVSGLSRHVKRRG